MSRLLRCLKYVLQFFKPSFGLSIDWAVESTRSGNWHWHWPRKMEREIFYPRNFFSFLLFIHLYLFIILVKKLGNNYLFDQTNRRNSVINILIFWSIVECDVSSLLMILWIISSRIIEWIIRIPMKFHLHKFCMFCLVLKKVACTICKSD